MNYNQNLGLSKKSSVQGLGTRILSSGIHLPKESVESTDIFSEFDSERLYGIPTNWMSEQMGIIERRMSAEDALPSDLAIRAAQNAIDNCDGLNKDHIDAVIFCGIERDQPEPATAHTIQKKLGLNANFAFDVANACFGFFDGLRVASSLIESNAARNVLVTTGEVPTKLTRKVVEQLKKGLTPKEAKQRMGFLSVGDAGGAVVVGRSGDGGLSGFRSFASRTLSKHNDLCYYKHLENGELEARMQMAKIVCKTIRLQENLLQEEQRKITWKKPDFLLTHQVGKRAFDQVASLNLVPKDRMIKSYDYLGNITSATFPINHHQLTNDSRLKEGDNIYGCYNGSGIVAGQLSYTY